MARARDTISVLADSSTSQSSLSLPSFKTGPSPIYLSREGRFEELLKLLDERRKARKKPYKLRKRNVFLLYAAAHGDLETVSTLIAKFHCDHNFTNDNGVSPLHCAAAGGHLSVVKYLVINKGVIPSPRPKLTYHEKWYGSALHYVCYAAKTSKERASIPLVKGVEYSSTSHDHIKVMKFLVEEGWDLQECSFYNMEPPCVLELICSCGGLNDLKYMVDHNHISVKQLRSSYICSRDNCDVKMAEYLVKCGALEVTPEWIYNCIGGVKDEILACLLKFCQQSVCSTTVGYFQQNTLLDIACQRNALSLASAIVEVNINSRDFRNRSPLHVACQHDKLELISFLVGKGADQGAINESGELPLHIAVTHGTFKTVQLVCSCDLNVQDQNGNSPLHLACKFDKADIVSFLVERGCNQNISNSGKQLPLHIAVSHASHEVVKLVSSCDVSKENKDGNTPLHLACKRRSRDDEPVVDIIRYLIKTKNCRVSVYNHMKELPFHTLLYQNIEWMTYDGLWPASVAVVDLVDDDFDLYLADKNSNTLLHLACLANFTDLVRCLVLKENFDINKIHANSDGCLPLHIACQQGSIDLVKLVSSGISNEGLFMLNDYKESALHLACEYFDSGPKSDHKAVVKYLVFEKHCEPINHPDIFSDLDIVLACTDPDDFQLLEKIATERNMNGVDKTGKPLMTACKANNIKAVEHFTQVLKCNCIDLNYRDYELPLHVACKQSSKMVDFIASCDGVDVNKPTSSYSNPLTPLHIACQLNMVEVVELLVTKYKCDQFIVNHNNEYPLHLACTQSLAVVKLLTVNSTLLQAVTHEGYTPLHIACKYNKLEIVLYLVDDLKCDISSLVTSGNLHPLQLACEVGSATMVKCLIENKGNTFEKSVDGNTPLHIACSSKSDSESVEVAQYLIDSGHDTKCFNRKQELPLHIACTKSLNLVKLTSHKCTTEELEAKTTDDITALHIAASHGLLDVVKYLVEVKNCSVFTLDYYGRNALAYACEHVNVASYLVQQGCNPMEDISKGHDTTASSIKFYARKASKYRTRNFIQQGYSADAVSSIEKSIHMRNFDLLKALVETDTSINALDEAGNTPLMLLCKYIAKAKPPRDCQSFCKFILSSITYLIDRKCHQHVQNKDGELALHILCSHKITTSACRSTIFKILNHMVLCGAEPEIFNKQNNNQQSPLHLAVINNNKEVVKFLLSEVKGISSTLKDVDGAAPVHYARSKKVVEMLIAHNHENLNMCNANADTLLHILSNMKPTAAVKECIQHLLSEGAFVAVKNKDGNTPLHLASSVKFVNKVKRQTLIKLSEKIIQLLLSHGSLVSATNEDGNTPVHLACDVGMYKHIKSLISHLNQGNKETHVTQDRVYEDKSIESFCKAISTRNKDGNTPLHIACLRKNAEIAKVLCESQLKCDLTTQNSSGDTPFHIACTTGSFPIVDYLVNLQGGCVDALSIANERGNLPFHVALELFHESQVGKVKKSVPTLEYFAKHCSDINTCNKDGETLLHLSCMVKNQFRLSLVQFFINHGADLEKTDIYGKLPLHIAASKSLHVAELCCTQAIVDVQDGDGNTPLHMACLNSNYQVIEFLLQKMKCVPNIMNSNKQTALHLASINPGKYNNTFLLLAQYTARQEESLCLQDINGA